MTPPSPPPPSGGTVVSSVGGSAGGDGEVAGLLGGADEGGRELAGAEEGGREDGATLGRGVTPFGRSGSSVSDGRIGGATGASSSALGVTSVTVVGGLST